MKNYKSGHSEHFHFWREKYAVCNTSVCAIEHRFGKTISVSMFAAALMFACAGCEVSIYSTCKRISTKLLRNVSMFLGIIYDVLKCQHHRIIRANQEEVHLQGDEGYRDVRIIQSYPSKVEFFATVLANFIGMQS